MCHFPSSPLCSDCTNFSSPHGADISPSMSLLAHGEAIMNCPVTLAQEQKVYFLILCNKDQILSLQVK